MVESDAIMSVARPAFRRTGAILSLVALLIAGCATRGVIYTEPAARDRAAEPETFSVTVSWHAPVTRANGECLTDLSGFVVLRGKARNWLDKRTELTVEEADCRPAGKSSECGPVLACTHTFRHLERRAWYFAVQAVDSQRRRSDYSETVPLIPR